MYSLRKEKVTDKYTFKKSQYLMPHVSEILSNIGHLKYKGLHSIFLNLTESRAQPQTKRITEP